MKQAVLVSVSSSQTREEQAAAIQTALDAGFCIHAGEVKLPAINDKNGLSQHDAYETVHVLLRRPFRFLFWRW